MRGRDDGAVDALAELSIRQASAGDLPALARYPHQLRLLADRLQRQGEGRGVLLVARSAGKPVGRVYVWLEPAEETEIREKLPDVALLIHLWVREESRHRGIGTALVRAAEALLQERGHRCVALGVGPDNEGAIRLYSRLGYASWQYPDIETTTETFLENGRRLRSPETCRIFVKELNTAAHG